MFKVIKSPWEKVFLQQLKNAKSQVYLASPFIKLQTASLISDNLSRDIDFRYINSFKLTHFHTGASDLEALKVLKNRIANRKIFTTCTRNCLSLITQR